MSNKLATTTTKDFFSQANVQAKFQELLGGRATSYITSVMSVVGSNSALTNVAPQSIYSAAMMAALLDLPVNQSLGMAYIVPYGGNAQFQLGYKGLIALAQRSGQYKTISTTPVYEGQLKSENPLEGFEFDWSAKLSDKIIGYAAYFKLINGFEKTIYWPKERVEAHGKRFSKTFSSGPWKTDFDAMAQKTVLKHLLGLYGPKSIEMQNAIIADQAVIRDAETMDVEYADMGVAEITIDQLQDLFNEVSDQLPADIYKQATDVITENREGDFVATFKALSKFKSNQ